MGRAIVRQPKVFLMDEPLSNLDAKLRTHMRTELKRLQLDLGVTTIYVTHDQAEAMTLGDRIACMYEGVFQQIGTPKEVYDAPVNKFVAGFIGSPSMNFFNGKLDGSMFITSAFQLKLPESKVKSISTKATDIHNITLGIRPEDIEDKDFALNSKEGKTISAKVIVRENYGSDIFLSVKASNISFTARVNADTKARVSDTVNLVFNLNKAHVFDGENEKNLII